MNHLAKIFLFRACGATVGGALRSSALLLLGGAGLATFAQTEIGSRIYTSGE